MVTYSYYVDMFINFFQIYDEFWKESDAEIDEDIAIDGTDSRCMSPLNVSDTENEGDAADTEVRLTVRWIVAILSIIQTRFFSQQKHLSGFLSF